MSLSSPPIEVRAPLLRRLRLHHDIVDTTAPATPQWEQARLAYLATHGLDPDGRTLRAVTLREVGNALGTTLPLAAVGHPAVDLAAAIVTTRPRGPATVWRRRASVVALFIEWCADQGWIRDPALVVRRLGSTFPAEGAVGGGRLAIERETRDGCTVLSLRGLLDASAAVALQETLEEALRDRPATIVVDLDEVLVPDPGVLSVFPMAVRGVGSWPDVRVVLSAPSLPVSEMLDRWRASGSIEVASSFDEAIAVAAQRPAQIRERHRFAAAPHTPRRARITVRQACSRWEIGDIAEEAELVTSELVTNALRHGQGSVQLGLSLSPDTLRIGVADSGDNLVTMRTPADPMGVVGRGLVIVAAVADSWGVKPRRRAGKEVWAVLRLPQAGQQRAS